MREGAGSNASRDPFPRPRIKEVRFFKVGGKRDTQTLPVDRVGGKLDDHAGVSQPEAGVGAAAGWLQYADFRMQCVARLFGKREVLRPYPPNDRAFGSDKPLVLAPSMASVRPSGRRIDCSGATSTFTMFMVGDPRMRATKGCVAAQTPSGGQVRDTIHPAVASTSSPTTSALVRPVFAGTRKE